MILAHLSDLHLGFRAYGRVDRGVDMRERDVAAAFERAGQRLVEIAPDVIVFAGDVFDRPDPPASAVVALARGLEALRAQLPDTPVLMVAGPRDSPRRPGDPGALAVLDTFPNVEAATGLTRSILIDRLGLHACLVPHRAVTRHPPALPEPDPRMRWNVLVMHARTATGAQQGVHVDPAEWDYVALGGEHRRRDVAPRVRYSGSLERVALDPWDEAADEKGFLSVDLESGRVTFHTVPVRPVVALAPVKVGRGDPETVRRRVREVTGEVPGGITDKIVRLRLQGASPTDLLALQGEPLRVLQGEALHLTVEAGPEPKAPAATWLRDEAPRLLRDEAPRLLREAVREELARDGIDAGEADALLDRCMPDVAPGLPHEGGAGEGPPGGPVRRPHGDVEALDGEVPGLGRVSTSVPLGLTAVMGGGGRARRAVAELFLRTGRTGPEGAVRTLWEGAEAETLAGAVRRAIQAVSESRGLGLVDVALARLGVGVAAPEGLGVGAPAPEQLGVGVAAPERTPPGSTPDERAPVGAVRVDPEQVAAEFRAAERELRVNRADVAEVDGDVEAATMDWLRERQDAETTLQAYRDKARELRARIRRMESAGPEAPCPTCGRVLAAHYEEVIEELRDEWEAVVQDGRWWRSRWDQLELKPEHLRELEGRSLRLHAALEAGSERVELLRARLQELDAGVATGTDEPEGLEAALVRALRRVRAARFRRASGMLLDRASRFVSRVSGGRILGVTWDDGVVHLQGAEGVLTPLSEEDLAAGKIALRLAAASLVAGGGRVLASLPLEQPFDRLDEEAAIRTLVLARALLGTIPRIVLFSRGDAVDARPELFDYVLEVREDAAVGAPLVRPVASGPGRIVLKAPLPAGVRERTV